MAAAPKKGRGPAGGKSKPGRVLALIIIAMVALTGGMFLSGHTTPRLGIDLAGGTSITLEAKSQPGKPNAINETNMNTAVSIIERRVNGLGVSEAEVQTQGDRNIIVNIPKGTNSKQAQDQVGTTAQLYFRPVLTEAQGTPTPDGTPSPSATGSDKPSATPSDKAGDTAGDKDADSDAKATPTASATTQGRAVTGALKDDASPTPSATGSDKARPPKTPEATSTADQATTALQKKFAKLDCSDKAARATAGDGGKPSEPTVACSSEGDAKYILGPAEVSGTDVDSAKGQFDQQRGIWIVTMDFTDKGSKKFQAITKKLSVQQSPQNQFAISLDGEVVSAPQVHEALSGSAEVDGEQVEAVPVGALAALRTRLLADNVTLPPPPGLAATLRDYQLHGLAWLGGCLADDMGLGKTITVIALHLHRAHPAPTLVVCPASLLGNWHREINRFAPGVPVRRFHGADRTLTGTATRTDTEPGFVRSTYGTMRSSADRLAAHTWGLVVADEAQHVKNPHSSTAKALRTIPSPARVALTGTPVENNLSELWALLDWTTPGLLGPLKAFRARHARIVESTDTAAGLGNDEAVERLSRLVRPFLLRRKKSDPGIAPELPPKTETDHPVSLTREQATLYEAAVRETMAFIEASEGIARRGLIMKLLGSLKQICNHPAQYLKEQPTRLAGRSGKLALLDELLDTILSEGSSVLIFTQYVTMARLLSAHLASRAIDSQLLHGGTPVPERERMVDRFQSAEVPVFLLSLKAAGTGLNLTRASHVIHYDRWWNPAVEEQATDRAYRIGQTQPVQVHRLIAEGTVEDRIGELLESKRALADAVLGRGGAALTELSDRDLADLVSLRRQP